MGRLDDYEEKDGERGIPRIAVIVGAIVVVAVIGAVLFAVLGRREQPKPDDEQQQPQQTVTVEDRDGGETSTESDIVGGKEPEQSVTEVPIEGDGDDAGQQTEGQTKDEQWRQEHMNDNSASIPRDQKEAMKNWPPPSEETLAQYGALDPDQMTDVARKWTQEWVSMINDGDWDGHSEVLKSMMDQDYVRNHSDEFEVRWLYECLMDSLYVSKESMDYGEIMEVNVINRIPSPLTYVGIKVRTTIKSTEGNEESFVMYKMALSKEYKVSRFMVMY